MSPDPDRLDALGRDLLALALDVALEAAALVQERAGAGVRVAATKTSPTDIVTEVDRASERLIRERLSAARPADAFLGEEGGRVAGQSTPNATARRDADDPAVTWIVDPLDGTVNYLYGLPSYAVSIAAAVPTAAVPTGVIAGVVVCPPTREVWTARLGGGAYLRTLPTTTCTGTDTDTGTGANPEQGTRLRLTDRPPVTDLAQALVGTGFWYDAALRARQAALLTTLLPRVRDIRRIGSAAVDLCGVATGRLDAFYETGLHPWDHAAGGLIAAEAGARVGGAGSGPPSRELTLVAAPGLYDQLHALVDGQVSLS